MLISHPLHSVFHPIPTVPSIKTFCSCPLIVTITKYVMKLHVSTDCLSDDAASHTQTLYSQLNKGCRSQKFVRQIGRSQRYSLVLKMVAVNNICTWYLYFSVSLPVPNSHFGNKNLPRLK